MPGPSAGAHQVLVYSGPGVSPLSLSHTVLTLSLLLLPHYTVQPITPQALASEPWETSCALLVIPGGRDLPYVEEMGSRGLTKRIREWVHEGGRYLGICAGGYFGCTEVHFDMGGELQVKGKRDLAFFPGTCAGPTFPGFAYAAESGSRAISLVLEPSPEASSSKTTLDHLYYNGGGHFVLPTPSLSNVEVLARYAEHATKTEDTSEDLPIAAVLTRNGKGKALLCSVHFEYPLTDPPARDAIAKLDPVPDTEAVHQSESARIRWAKDLLRQLGLQPPEKGKGKDERDDEPSLLLHPTHPSPIFVLSHPSLPQLGEGIFSATALQDKLKDGDGRPRILRDGNDELHLVNLDAVSQTPVTADDVTTYLSEQRSTPPIVEPDMSSLSLQSSSTTPQLPQPSDFHATPKTILLPTSDLLYTPRWTPLFNSETYWSDLDAARKRSGKKSGVLRRSSSGAEQAALGDCLLYAETVTSTQTMLDRNPLLLTHLPTPLAFLATFQLSGRGRGSNIWLSPAGCLQFSLLLDLPAHLSSKLVFIQYLMALAVCEAVDEDGRLGVRIKWPNDIYAEVEGVGGTEVGGGVKGKAKLGGILVNTNFVGGKWRIVVGTGINVLNALPTTSLSQLHSILTTRLGPTAQNLPSAPTMEGTFAKIMCAFDSKWEQFIEEGGFKGFMHEYQSRWLHSNQEVTLTTVEPHQRLRIQSITPDHGLLRCVPIDPPGGVSKRGLTPLYSRGDFGDEQRSTESQFVDLQPDGNSFDMMSGLIKRKV